MVSKIIVSFCFVVVVVSATVEPSAAAGQWPWGPPTGVNPWIPPWVQAAPWYPQWAPCTAIGATCVDCNTKQVCTKVGGLTRACTDPTMPHCNAGECSATPSAECAVPTVSA